MEDGSLTVLVFDYLKNVPCRSTRSRSGGVAVAQARTDPNGKSSLTPPILACEPAPTGSALRLRVKQHCESSSLASCGPPARKAQAEAWSSDAEFFNRCNHHARPQESTFHWHWRAALKSCWRHSIGIQG